MCSDVNFWLNAPLEIVNRLCSPYIWRFQTFFFVQNSICQFGAAILLVHTFQICLHYPCKKTNRYHIKMCVILILAIQIGKIMNLAPVLFCSFLNIDFIDYLNAIRNNTIMFYLLPK